MAEMRFKVAGMSCDGCVRNVTGVLKALSGVTEAEVSLDEASARVAYDPGEVTAEQVRQAVIDAGFDCPTD